MKAGVLLVFLALGGCAEEVTLTVAGSINSHITSSPEGIDCDIGGAGTCEASFEVGTHVRLSYDPPVDTGSCPIYNCSTGPAEAAVAPQCREIVMNVPVTAFFACAAP